MSQPFVKFVAQTLSYMVFVALIIASTIEFAQIETRAERFSTQYPNFTKNFVHYVEREDLKYKFFESDFYIREFAPSLIDVIISVWIVGKFNFFYNLKKFYRFLFKLRLHMARN
jgi:hypothetical protein